jgi:DnaJ-class molecular chaperone
LTRSFRTYSPSFDEIFDWLWQNFSSLSDPKSGTVQNLTVTIPITPEQALRGGEARIRVPARVICPSCRGRGGIGFHECWRCAGEGAITGEFPLNISFPAGIPGSHTVQVPLDRFGIYNMYLTVNFSVSEEA